ncbi:MAG: AAA family ATPase [Polyangiaceae bacterium]|nr:AAA family ATPase [Polyangiaceae bacterium]
MLAMPGTQFEWGATQTMSDIFKKLLRLAKAQARTIHIASYEWERVQGFALGLSRDLDLPLRVWSAARGVEVLHSDGRREPDEPDNHDPLEVLKHIDANEQPGIWLLEDVHPYLSSEHHQLLRWIRQMCRMPESPRKLILLSTPGTSLHPDLCKEIPTVDVPLPDSSDLSTECRRVATDLDTNFTESSEALIEAARGLTVMEARLAFAQAAVENGRLDDAGVALVASEKERIIRQSGVLEYYHASEQWGDIGGLESLKKWLDQRGRGFRQGARNFGLEAPKGVLMLGVQGCGKSLLAKAVAAKWQFPLLRLDVGKVYAGIVGESEANIRKALQVAQALAPCVLWMDEIEKGLSGVDSSSQTDSGTSARVLGTLLTWMQEKKEPVFVVATANRVELLPPELLRKGRFDEIFFVDLPTEASRQEILNIHLRRKQRKPEEFDIPMLAQASAGFSGAELEEAIREGMFDAFSDNEEVKTKHILTAIKSTYPLSRTMREPIEGLRKWAKVRARAASNEAPEDLPAADSTPAPQLKQEKALNPFVPPAK